jgi:hypothetical protein
LYEVVADPLTPEGIINQEANKGILSDPKLKAALCSNPILCFSPFLTHKLLFPSPFSLLAVDLISKTQSLTKTKRC